MIEDLLIEDLLIEDLLIEDLLIEDLLIEDLLIEERADGTIVEKIGPLGTFVPTNVNLTPEEIIESYSKRFSNEEMFKDLKEVCGLGKQQGRNLESNLACFQALTMTILCQSFGPETKTKHFEAMPRPEGRFYPLPMAQNKLMTP